MYLPSNLHRTIRKQMHHASENPDQGLYSVIRRWMDDLRFYDLFNSIRVVSRRWADDNKRLCAMETRLRFGRFRLERVSNR